MGSNRSKPSVRVLNDSDDDGGSVRSFDTPRPGYRSMVTPNQNHNHSNNIHINSSSTQKHRQQGRQDEDEDDIFSRKKRLRCPQCHIMAQFKVAFYNDNSACSECMEKLRKGKPIKQKNQAINYGGQQKDMRFPQNVAWDFGKSKEGDQPKKKRKTKKQDVSDQQLELKLSSFTGNEFLADASNRKFKSKPLPASNRQVLDKIAEKQPNTEDDLLYISDEEVIIKKTQARFFE